MKNILKVLTKANILKNYSWRAYDIFSEIILLQDRKWEYSLEQNKEVFISFMIVGRSLTVLYEPVVSNNILF